MPAAEVALGARRWDGGDRLPVLLVHGLSSNARLWDEVAAALGPDPTGPPRHPVLAVDLRGHGTSAGVPDPPGSDATEVAVAEISGDFPGSPVDLSFTFRFDERDRIAALTIRP